MSSRYQLTRLALDDLDSIYWYIAEDSAQAANRVEQAILDACEKLAQNPHLGSTRAEFTSLALRFWPVSRFPNFLVVYWPETKPLQVVAIWHGNRQFSNLKSCL